MKRKLLAIITSVLLLCAMLPLGAISVAAATSGITGLCSWKLDGTHLTISGYGEMADYEDTGPWGRTITSLTIEDGVTAIGVKAFYNCYKLTSVTMGNSVTIIGESAFAYGELIQKINIPDSVRYIGASAFSGCECMWFTLPDNITYIGKDAFNMTANDDVYGSPEFYAGKSYSGGKYLLDVYGGYENYTVDEGTELIAAGAFSGNSSFVTVTIPDSVTTICGVVFSGCHKLSSIEVDDNNPDYCDVDGVLYSKDMTQLLKYPAQRSGTAYTIPDGVTTIDEGAFENCAYLTSITIPDSVTAIGVGAFAGGSSLMTVEVDDNNGLYCDVDGVLFNKDATELIQYPSGHGVDYTIPNSVTTIGERSFYNCRSLTSVTIPDSVITIEEEAFYYCACLISVTVPDSVTTIGDDAFYACDRLQAVTIGNGDTAIGEYAFYYCEKLTTVTIGNGDTTIGEHAFYYCKNLTTVTIGDGVTTIDNMAFYNCDSLTDVYYVGTETSREKIAIGYLNDPLLNATWHYAADPISTTVTHSVMDTAKGNGLAFRFELAADGVAMVKRTEADLTSATVNYLGTDCKLVGMGAVITNSAAVGETKFTHADVNDLNVVDIPVVYLMEANEDSCAFATRIINIPDEQLERVIYARPYYVVEVDGEEIVVYGDVDSASCAEYM